MVAGKSAMVHEPDRKNTDAALALFRGQINPPPEWKAAWRKKMKWRGLSTELTRRPSVFGQSGLPVVCFNGPMNVPRQSLLEQAAQAGWEDIDTVHSRSTVLVAADRNIMSKKLRFARKHGIPGLTLDDWHVMREDACFQAIKRFSRRHDLGVRVS